MRSRALQAGLIPHEIDEDGNAINPHIPQFMAAAPWYLKQDGPGLKHQKAPKKAEESAEWYKRGVTTTVATKFRKGACENCGAMTHKKKDCMERPRARGASKTQKDIAADEYVQPELNLGFESKRDRYNGFDVDDYVKVVERYEAADAMKQKLAKQKELERAFRRANKKEDDAASDSDSDDTSSDDDDDETRRLRTRRRQGLQTSNAQCARPGEALPARCATCVFAKTRRNICATWMWIRRTTTRRRARCARIRRRTPIPKTTSSAVITRREMTGKWWSSNV